MGNCCRSIGAPDSPHWHSDQPIRRMEHFREPEDAQHAVELSVITLSKREIIPASEPLPSQEFGSFSTLSAVPLQQPSWISSRAYGCANFDVTNRATTIEWKGHGLKIQILDDSIPHYITTARLNVSVHCVCHPLYLPVPQRLDIDRDYQPVSVLYSIKVDSGKLCKPVTIEIQHCSSLTAESLTLLRASNEREDFRPVADAVFDRRTNYGRVIVPKLNFVKDQEYDDFCWFIIAIRQVFFPNTIYYRAQVYISKTTMMMHFIVTMALDPCSTVSCLQRLGFNLIEP